MNSSLAVLQVTTPVPSADHPGNLPTIDAAPSASLVTVRGLITGQRYQLGPNRGTAITLTDTTGSIEVFIPRAVDRCLGLRLGAHLSAIGRTGPEHVLAVRIAVAG